MLQSLVAHSQRGKQADHSEAGDSQLPLPQQCERRQSIQGWTHTERHDGVREQVELRTV
jgi:hypothetical protein